MMSTIYSARFRGWQTPVYRVVHVNELSGDAHYMAHLLEFDSVHGRRNHDRQGDSEGLAVDGNVPRRCSG
ncbi:MAG: glyceraldehyde 3-phosphate dehydrogenase NAD-binding domain-containing protein [Thiogranum sp.]